MVDIEDDVVIVTGASRGIGQKVALACSRAGASVILVARDGDRLEAVAREAANDTLVAPTDIRNDAAIERTVESCLDRFGPPDTLVNNAGTGLLSLANGRKPVHEINPEEWETVVETNLTGTFLFSRAVLGHMADRGSGNVINVSSELGSRAIHGWSPYISSKFGVEGFTQTAALDYEEDGVNVNAIYPGGRVATGFWEHLAADETEDLEDPTVMNEAVLALASQGPDGITGESHDQATWLDRLGE